MTEAEDRAVKQKEAAYIMGMSVATLRRQTWIPRVARPTNGRKRKVVYVYRLSTLLRLLAELEEKAS